MKSCRTLFLAACAFGVIHTAPAALFSNLGEPNNLTANIGNPPQTWGSDFFTQGYSATITGVSIDLYNFDTMPHTLTLSLMSDNGGMPGALIGSFDPLVLPARNFSVISTTSAGLNVAANSKYWLILHQDSLPGAGWNGTDSSGTEPGSLFSTVPATGFAYSTNDGASYTMENIHGDENLKFSFQGVAVPEPASAGVVFGLGAVLVATGLPHRRRVR